MSASTSDLDGELDEPVTLLDRVMRRTGRGGAPAAWFLLGGGLLGLLVESRTIVSIAAEPWELDASSPVVESVDSECGPFMGATLTIEVDGRRHACRGSNEKCEEGPVAVAYDPAAPSRCRAAVNVDHPSFFEWWLMMLTCSFTLMTISGASYLRSETLRTADIVDGAPVRLARRRRLRKLGAAALIAFLAVNVAGFLGIVLLVGRD